jgi:hypothetical protein
LTAIACCKCTLRGWLGCALTACVGLACNADQPSEPEPPTDTHAGLYVLEAVADKALPASVRHCNPDCTGSRLVYEDTLEIRDEPPARFRWEVSWSDEPGAPTGRIEVTGKLIAAGVGFWLEAENHPVLPPSVHAGLFYWHRFNAVYELQASPPWSTVGLTKFRYRRIVAQ